MVRLSQLRDEIADGYVLGPVRVAVGALLGWTALADAQERASFGYFGDFFHLPMIPEAFVPSDRAHALLLALRASLAIMVLLAIRARPALAVSALLGVWLLLCDRLHFEPWRLLLGGYALLLSLTPCDRSWRIAEGEATQPRVGPFWAVRLCQLQIAFLYFASGGSKLVDRDVGEALARHDSASAFAKLAILTELLLCVALWLRPMRIVALWCGVWLHVVISSTIKFDLLTLVTLAMYGVFATPDHRARALHYDPSRFRGKLAATLVPLLDWLGRFEIKPWEPDDRPGHSIVVVRRDGERVTGIRAFAMLARCLPLLFPLWAPLMLIASFTRQGDLTTAS